MSEISSDLYFRLRRGEPSNHLSPLKVSTSEMVEDRLARALHEWKMTQQLAGCGWVFGTDLCPCRVDAAAILFVMNT